MDQAARGVPFNSPVEHTSIFLLPMALRRSSERRAPSLVELAQANEALVEALRAAGWQLVARAPHEGTYFHHHARDIPRERCLRRDKSALPAGLEQADLYLFSIGIVVLTLHFEGSRPFQELLEWHEQARYLDRIYRGQALGPSALVGEEPDGSPEWPWKHKLVHDLLRPALEAARAQGWCFDVFDKRMMVHAWVALPADAPAELDPLWLPLLFVDQRPGQSFNGTEEFEQTLRDRHEYRRWWHTSRIGFTRYSFLVLGRQEDGHIGNSRRDVRGSYLWMTLLGLVQRSKLLGLKHHVALLAQQLSERPVSGAITHLAEQWRNIKEVYLLFAARYWSVEMTGQDQGIEMSQQWALLLNTHAFLQEIREEIERFEAHMSAQQAQLIAQQAQVSAQQGERLNREVAQLTYYAVVIGVVGLWCGFLGTNKPVESLGSGAWWLCNGGSTVVIAIIAINLAKRVRPDRRP